MSNAYSLLSPQQREPSRRRDVALKRHTLALDGPIFLVIFLLNVNVFMPNYKLLRFRFHFSLLTFIDAASANWSEAVALTIQVIVTINHEHTEQQSTSFC